MNEFTPVRNGRAAMLPVLGLDQFYKFLPLRARSGISRFVIAQAQSKMRKLLFRYRRKVFVEQVGWIPYLDMGGKNRPLLVWLHGFMDCKESFYWSARLLKRKFRVVVPDIPGFGESAKLWPVKYSFSNYVGWLAQFIEGLGAGPVHLVGNSMGGALALQLAYQHPHLVRTLTPVCSAGVLTEQSEAFFQELFTRENPLDMSDRVKLEEFLQRLDPDHAKIPHCVKDLLFAYLSHHNEWHMKILKDLISDFPQIPGVERREQTLVLNDRLPQIKAPTLIVWGDRDGITPLCMGELMARELPSAHLQVFKGVGHAPHLQAVNSFTKLLIHSLPDLEVMLGTRRPGKKVEQTGASLRF